MITTVQCSICSQLNNKPRVVVTDFRLHHAYSIIILGIRIRIMPRAVQPSVWTGRAPVDHEVTLQCRYEREKQQLAFETAEERSSFK